jgi:hypothetical protein
MQCISESQKVRFPYDETVSFNVVLARHGYIGTSPLHPAMAISYETLHLLDVLTMHCPQLSLQAFAKTISQLHRVCYKKSRM